MILAELFSSVFTIFASVMVVILAVVSFCLWYDLRSEEKDQRKELEALSLILSNDLGLLDRTEVDLTGHWTRCKKLERGNHIWGMRLEQHGIFVSGWMNPKFSSALRVRGIINGNQLIGVYSRLDHNCMGSGVIQLNIEEDGKVLRGSSKWRYASDEPDKVIHFEHRWERDLIDKKTDIAGEQMKLDTEEAS
ncbi:hypothetical protein IIA94_02265 [Patescibacteria group bacterium]|nr:hypothetical protein [Patescibacteria group bacterium]